MRLYSLFDRQMKEFGPIIAAQNDSVIVRNLRDNLPPQSMEARHPEDFDLMFLGVISLETGVIASSTPSLVGGLSSLLVPPSGGPSLGGE